MEVTLSYNSVIEDILKVIALITTMAITILCITYVSSIDVAASHIEYINTTEMTSVEVATWTNDTVTWTGGW